MTMNSDQRSINCGLHGRQGIGLVCEHIAFAVDKGERIGFFWGDETDTARPDAWCSRCEQALIALDGGSSEQWFTEARFKVFCAGSWDQAKATCGGFPSE
jgi:hypothetical protein